jgi:hypothetical protein
VKKGSRQVERLANRGELSGGIKSERDAAAEAAIKRVWKKEEARLGGALGSSD